MAQPGLRRTAVHTVAALLLVTALAGCGSDDDGSLDAPQDAAPREFCQQLEDAPGAEATADDYRAYAARLEGTGTPPAIDGAAREGFELFVGYLATLEDGDVDKVKASDEPSDVFSGDDATKVESFKQGYVVTCTDGDGAVAPSATATPTGGVLGGVGSAP